MHKTVLVQRKLDKSSLRLRDLAFGKEVFLGIGGNRRNILRDAAVPCLRDCRCDISSISQLAIPGRLHLCSAYFRFAN